VKKLFLFMLVAMLVVFNTVVFAAEPDTSGDQEIVKVEVVIPPDLIVSAPDQNAEEVQIPTATDNNSRYYLDEYILALKENAHAKIQARVAEIEQLADRSDEGEVQKKIEKIKLEEEITRLHIQIELAKDDKDQKLVAEMEKEIAHLKTMDQAVIGVPGEQPVLEMQENIGKEEVVR
jgi:DNA-binding transcriptional MerR regulator